MDFQIVLPFGNRAIRTTVKRRLLKLYPWPRRVNSTCDDNTAKFYVDSPETSVLPTGTFSVTSGPITITKSLKKMNSRFDDAVETGVTDTSVLQGLSNIAEGYSKAHGTCISWETDVNLNPPSSWKQQPPEGDRYLSDYWNSLQYTLYETDHSETTDRTHKPRTIQNKEQVNVVLLSSPVECIGILIEGGKHVPGGFHLVMSPSWLSKTPTDETGTSSRLWLHKSISFHEHGTTFIDEYKPPRLVTYLVNYFTDNVTSGHRNDGAAIEKNIDCPMSSSIQLCEMVDDKVWTRDIMTSVGMATPITLALRKRPRRKLLCGNSDLKYVDFSIYSLDDRNVLEDVVTKLCEKLSNTGIGKVVVKPSGPQFLGSIGVSFHDVTETIEVMDAAEALLVNIDDGCSVLVEEFIEPIKPLRSGTEDIPLWLADEDLGFRVRATVCRDHDNIPVTTLINCNIGQKDSPINGDNSVCQTLESTLQGYNIQDKSVIHDLESAIRVQSAKVLQGIIERENMLSSEERGSIRGQTDVIGIDLIITEKGGKLIPVGIEVNGHDCTINTQLFDFMTNLYTKTSGICSQHTYNLHNTHGPNLTTTSLPNYSKILQNSLAIDAKINYMVSASNEKLENLRRIKAQEDNLQELRYSNGDAIGRSVRPLVRNMIARSQHYTMQGKRILVVGAGGISKISLWPDAKKYGIEVILVDSDPNHVAKDDVYKMLHCDFDDHNQDLAHARDICNQLHVLGEKVDGCVTFWEDCVPLAALLSKILGTKGITYQDALTGKKKSRTQNALCVRTGDIPHWPRTFLYASPSCHLTSCDDIESAVKRINFPAFLKLEHGSSAVAGSIVNSVEELTMKFKNISNKLTSEKDFTGIGLGHDNSMVVMDFIGGSEHDIDVIIYDRKLIGAFISDNGPTNYPNFIETSATMPSTLPEDKQAQLVTAAYQCCTEIGLSNGTYNVEMKMTKMGPKLIEINARMGGFYLREWIQKVYGVDLMLCAMMISAGIKPYVPKHPPSCQLMGIMLVPSHHDHLFRDDNFFNTMKAMGNDGDLIFKQLSNSTQVLLDQYEEPFANITVSGTSVADAKGKLKHVCEKLDIDCDNYNVDDFLKHF